MRYYSFAVLALVALVSLTAAEENELRVNGDRLNQRFVDLAPIGMIFIPSVDGISHSPKEYSRPGDIENGANVLLHTILEIDQGL